MQNHTTFPYNQHRLKSTVRFNEMYNNMKHEIETLFAVELIFLHITAFVQVLLES